MQVEIEQLQQKQRLFLFVNTFSFSKKYEELKQNILQKFNLIKIDDIVSKYFTYAVMFQICFIYLFAGFHKLQGEVWVDGTAL